MVSRSAAAVLTSVALLALAGCGSDGTSGTATDVQSGGSATSEGGAVLPPTIAAAPSTATATGTTAAPATTTNPESQPGGAGDEEAAVVPAAFTFGSGGVSPDRIEVPAFFTIRVSGAAEDGQDHELVFQGKTIAIPAGKTRAATVTGLKPGTYPVTVDGAQGAATIVVSSDAAGP